MTNLDMYTSIVGVLVLKARESLRLPGLMATAAILLRLGALGSCQTLLLLDLENRKLQHTCSKYRLSAYIHMTMTSLEIAYFWNPRPKVSVGSSDAGFTSRSKSSGRAGGYFSRLFLPGQCASLEKSRTRPPAGPKLSSRPPTNAT